MNKMSGLVFICTVVLGINAHGIFAQEAKWYIGAGLGATEIETDIVPWSILGPDYLDHSERDLGYKIFGGCRLNDFLGIEVSYIDFGAVEVAANSGSFIASEGVVWEFTQDGTLLSMDVSAIGLGVILRFPLEKIIENKYLERITPVLKFGGHYWRAEKELSPSGSANFFQLQNPRPNPVNPTNHTVSDNSGLSWFYGAGFNLKINRRFDIIVSYEWYNFDKNMAQDADFISAGVIVKF